MMLTRVSSMFKTVVSSSARDRFIWRKSVPGGTRTPNLLIRSQMLYPVELQTQLIQPGERETGGQRDSKPMERFRGSARSAPFLVGKMRDNRQQSQIGYC